ncbi:hypothetical protein PBRA_003156 [Plasmodiophora brassicae]|uniref:GH16 domain-containing protein n=1 Tax=Plasmodiophora brassicae TaxID=37360 RepID=A0A0G4J7X7_PLABS|nr:hypothetical protein PBRA_003156 [Plasmodiophora brassicae]
MGVAAVLLTGLAVWAIGVASGVDRNGRYAGRPIPDGPNGRVLVFSDEFDALDTYKWQHEVTLGGGGNWEFQLYSNNRSNSYTRDGILYLRPTLTADMIGEANVRSGYTMDLWGNEPGNLCTGNAFYGCQRTSGAGGNYLNPIMSARLRSSRSFHFKYGRVEVRAKLPRGDWIWPAIWFLPQCTCITTRDWPASGEIDMIESRGNADYPPGLGVDTAATTLHWGPWAAEDQWPKTHGSYTLPKGTYADDFHLFVMEWSESRLTTYVDTPDNIMLDVHWNKTGHWEFGGWDDDPRMKNPWEGRGSNAPFDQEFFMIMNVAVGGTNTYFEDGVGGKPWVNSDQHSVNKFWDAKDQWLPTWDGEDAAMKVDYVRIYQAKEHIKVTKYHPAVEFV